MPIVRSLRGSVSDLVAVRAQLRRVASARRIVPFTADEQTALDSAIADTERALATLAGLAGVRYPP